MLHNGLPDDLSDLKPAVCCSWRRSWNTETDINCMTVKSNRLKNKTVKMKMQHLVICPLSYAFITYNHLTYMLIYWLYAVFICSDNRPTSCVIKPPVPVLHSLTIRLLQRTNLILNRWFECSHSVSWPASCCSVIGRSAHFQFRSSAPPLRACLRCRAAVAHFLNSLLWHYTVFNVAHYCKLDVLKKGCKNNPVVSTQWAVAGVVEIKSESAAVRLCLCFQLLSWHNLKVIA